MCQIWQDCLHFWRWIIFYCLYILYFLYLCVDGQGCLYILVIINNIAMNMRTQIALCNPDFSSFREVPKSETVGSQCFHFNFFEEPLYWFPWYLYCFTGEGNVNPLQYSWLENSTGKGEKWAVIHGVTEWDKTKWLKHTHTDTHTHTLFYIFTNNVQWF